MVFILKGQISSISEKKCGICNFEFLSILICISIGTSKTISFLLFQMENKLFLGVPIFKHIRVFTIFKRNRFLLTVICWPKYHRLGASLEVDISQRGSTSDIFTDNWPTASDILGNKSLISKTRFRI